MATSSLGGRHCRFGRGGPHTALTWLLIALLVCLPGCRGCRKTPEQIEKEKQEADDLEKEKEKLKKKKETKPFEADQPYVLPTNIVLSPGMYKPGHWLYHSWPNVKSNLGDFQGEVQTQVTEFGNNGTQRVPLTEVLYHMTDQRPAALAKEQPKALESSLWVPPRLQVPSEDDTLTSRSVDFKLTTAGGATAAEMPMSLQAMPSYQYKFIVLSRGSRFDYLSKRLESIRSHYVNVNSGPPLIFYQVITMSPSKRPSLPTNALCWTSIAYLLWDESDPTHWDLDQRQALIDWLHWGGQLIVSGPDALEQLQNSFLRPYLPATVGKARTFTENDLMCLQYWGGENSPGPSARSPWPGAELKIDGKLAHNVPHAGENMVIERPVGRGRIVATAFRISGSEFSSWQGCDCFFNACLLRRGPREVAVESPTRRTALRWAKTTAIAEEEKRESAWWNAVNGAGDASTGEPPRLPDTVPDAAAPQQGDGTNDPPGPAYPPGGYTATPSRAPRPSPAPSPEPANRTLSDAARNTALRYFSRDTGVCFADYAADIVKAREQALKEAVLDTLPRNYSPGHAEVDDGPMDGDDRAVAVQGPGLCAWNDFGPVAQTARNALENATGITVPPRSFIVWVVAGYLCVLVPANWFFFRLIRRVEWAWIAAPFIAIGCTIVVVNQAQLNLGFARTRNEIAIVEMQPGYPRAHLTRYTALYTSLATSYELCLTDPGGQILPFSTVFALSDFGHKWGDSHRDAFCRRGDDTRLSGIHVDSNSKEYVHSEEMSDFGGTVTLHKDSDGNFRVTNGTKHPLQNCQVVRCNGSNDSEMAAIDRLEPGATAKLRFGNFQRQPALVSPYLGKPAQPTGELNDEGVRLAALHLKETRQGEVFLVARVARAADEAQGLTVVPEVPQNQFRQTVLLVAHLDAGQFEPPAPDEARRSSGRTLLPDSPRGTVPESVDADDMKDNS